MVLFASSLHSSCSLSDLLIILSSTSEYEELPVRHNEDKINEQLSKEMLLPHDLNDDFESPHTKANMLFQAHFMRLSFPISDYYTDLKSVLDQALRILQAMVDVTAESGWLNTTLKVIQLNQMIVQGRWLTDSQFTNLPNCSEKLIANLWDQGIQTLPQAMEIPIKQIQKVTNISS